MGEIGRERMEDRTIMIITGIVCITVLETIALLKGIDGSLMALAFSTIGGILGFKAGKIKSKRKKK